MPNLKFLMMLSVFVIVIIIVNSSLPVLALESGQEYISFGADLDKSQRDQMLNYFNPVKRPVLLEITNPEEYYYLSKYIPKEQIGSRAISSVYIQTLALNSGIQVQTHQITWVTEGMYANAAVTAGVKDVLIKAAAPISVSGTAALTGIFKAFEKAQRKPLSPRNKEIAYEELVTTGELGEEIGQRNSEILIRDVKEEVVKKGVKDPKEIRIIIESKASKYNVNLSEDQVKQIVHLMEKVNEINLNLDDINNQLKNLETRVKGVQEQGEKVGGILNQILTLFQQLFNLIAKIFSSK